MAILVYCKYAHILGVGSTTSAVLSCRNHEQKHGPEVDLGITFRAKFPGVAANAAATTGDHIHDGNNSRVVHFPFPISITTDCLLWTLFSVQ